VLLIAGAGNARGPGIHALLLTGFATMFLADIVWSLARMRGYYLPGGFHVVLYLCCCIPLSAAGREQLRASAARTNSDNGPELARAVITLGETLGLETVAEGIELEPQVAALLALGCVAGRGFLFARAGSLAQLSDSPFAARRRALWTVQAAQEQLSATGRFKSLRSRPRP
jgi:EAL domain